MARYKLTIAYEGTSFCGWQKQTPPAGTTDAALLLPRAADVSVPETARARDELRTVQEVVERAVRGVVREPVVVMGASRTDSGVHARGQVAAFTCSDGTPPHRGIGWSREHGCAAMVRAINSRLPEDVLVVKAEEAGPEFDPIQGAVRKAYSYTIWNGPVRPLWERRTALHVWAELDAAKMNEAAALLVGEHDFGGFAAAGHGRLSTVRRVFECRVQSAESRGQSEGAARRLVIDVVGSGFLWNMVRIISGTLVEVGKGRMDASRVTEALRTGKRELAGPTLPGHGLCLEWIDYG